MNKPTLACPPAFSYPQSLQIRKIKYFRTLDSSHLIARTRTSKAYVPSKILPSSAKYVSNLTMSFDVPENSHLHDRLAHVHNRFAKTVRKISTYEVRDWKIITPSSCFGLSTSRFLQFKCLKQIKGRARPYPLDNSNFQSLATSLDALNNLPSHEHLSFVRDSIRFWYLVPKTFEVVFEVAETQSFELDKQNPPFSISVRFSPANTNDFAGKPVDWWNITGVEIYFPNWDSKIESALSFVNKLPQLKSLHLHLNKTQTGSLQSLMPFFSNAATLKNLTVICDGLALTSQDLITLQFPKNLTSLCLRIGQGLLPQNIDDLMGLSYFDKKIKELTELKSLDLAFPTTFYVNQMVHNMPNTLVKLENLKLAFVEENERNGFEEFYVNSCLEWTMSMPNLKTFSLKSNRLNYTYCSFLDKNDLPENIQRIEWTDQCLSNVLKPGNETYSNEMWIECKKNEDINVVLGVLSPKETRYFEMPLVFDVLPAHTALEKLVEVLSPMEKLEKAVLAVGFKLLEFKDILAVEETLQAIRTSLGQRRVPSLTMRVYFRELSSDIPVDLKIFEEQRDSRWPGSEIRYIYSPY